MENPNLGIHGNSTFIDFEFSFFTIPILLLFIPLLYIPYTTLIIIRIFSKLLLAMKEKTINVELFKAITVAHFLNLLFFIADVFYIRLPITGVFTSWCASSQPNGYIVFLIIITYHLNYSLMLMPFLVALVRLNLIMMPTTHRKINSILLKISFPIILIYPIFFTFFMYPAVGYCDPASYPLQFGAILFYINQSLFGLRNGPGLIFNTFFWLTACLVMNSVFILKLVKLNVNVANYSRKLHRAELSLTLTSISMSFSYVTNGMVVVGGYMFPSLYAYIVILRPFMNDLDTCIAPWVFYLTHPVFRRKVINLVVRPENFGSQIN